MWGLYIYREILCVSTMDSLSGKRICFDLSRLPSLCVHFLNTKVFSTDIAFLENVSFIQTKLLVNDPVLHSHVLYMRDFGNTRVTVPLFHMFDS